MNHATVSAVGAALAPLPQPGFGITGRRTRLFNEIDSTRSNIPLIWTGLTENSPGRLVLGFRLRDQRLWVLTGMRGWPNLVPLYPSSILSSAGWLKNGFLLSTCGSPSPLAAAPRDQGHHQQGSGAWHHQADAQGSGSAGNRPRQPGEDSSSQAGCSKDPACIARPSYLPEKQRKDKREQRRQGKAGKSRPGQQYGWAMRRQQQRDSRYGRDDTGSIKTEFRQEAQHRPASWPAPATAPPKRRPEPGCRRRSSRQWPELRTCSSSSRLRLPSPHREKPAAQSR